MDESAQDAGQLLAAARAGSREALGNVLESCRKYLSLVAARELDCDLHAKGGTSDLVQETFLEAQRDFARFQGNSEGELLAWLRQILLNNVSNFTRRYRGTRKRELNREVPIATEDSASSPGLVLPDLMLTPYSQAVQHEQAEALRRAVERLPEEYRQAIVLRYLEGRSFEEIGQRLGRSPDAARKLWSRAMERLRQQWEGQP
jgi:RNA polymerase sigma-70 factor (ECF subfamily)